MKKVPLLILVFVMVPFFVGCSVEKGIKIGMTKDKEGTISDIVDQIPANQEVYIQYTQSEAFNAESVELVIYAGDNLISGASTSVDKDDNTVIFTIEIAKPGLYTIRVSILENEVYQQQVRVYDVE